MKWTSRIKIWGRLAEPRRKDPKLLRRARIWETIAMIRQILTRKCQLPVSSCVIIIRIGLKFLIYCIILLTVFLFLMLSAAKATRNTKSRSKNFEPSNNDEESDDSAPIKKRSSAKGTIHLLVVLPCTNVISPCNLMCHCCKPCQGQRLLPKTPVRWNLVLKLLEINVLEVINMIRNIRHLYYLVLF